MARANKNPSLNRPLYDAPRVKSKNPSKGPKYPDKTTQRANFNRMETEGRVGMRAYSIKPKNVDPKFEIKGSPENIDPKFEIKDLPMSREGSPTVTDTETGEVTYGRPKDFNKGGMMECRGGGIAITGKKFQGVF